MVSFKSTDGPGSTIQVSESDGSLVVVLVLSKAVGEQVSVFVIATNITARGLLNLLCMLPVLINCSLAGSDYGPSQNYTVTFPAGSTRQSLTIPIINDSICEHNEAFQLKFSVPEATVKAGIIDGCDINVQIVDDDCISKFQVIVVTRAQVVCLICTPKPKGHKPEG